MRLAFHRVVHCAVVCAGLLAGATIILLAPRLARAAEPAPAGDVAPANPLLTEITRKAVDDRIAAEIAEIWRNQSKAGHWPDEGKPVSPARRREEYEQYTAGGETAMMLLALKVAGVDEEDPRFQAGLKWLVEQPWHGVYFRGLRATLYGQLRDPKYKKLLFEDGEFLLGCLRPSGLFSYYTAEGPAVNSKVGDFSNTQYGVLGIWAAADRGFEVPTKFWQLVERGYLASIAADGGWSYHFAAGAGGGRGREDGYGSMTAAALATLFIIWEKNYVMADRDCSGRVNPDLLRAIQGGLDWMASNFSATEVPMGVNSSFKDFMKTYTYYYFYSLERAGVASGLKYFGKHDWYKEVTLNILNNKVPMGGRYDHAWALLFLCYGRAPVAFNKLDYGPGWNEHPREYAAVCKYLSRTSEKHRNWQIMPLNADPRDLHDSPILAMSGKTKFTFKPAEIRKIKDYLQQGGLLFAEAIDNSPNFSASVKALCRKMFPNLELVRLDARHPIYSAHNRLVNGQPELLGLSDGVRTLVILSPKDLSCDWQRLNFVAGKAKFELADNLVQYASDSGQLWTKEESHWPRDAGKKPAATVTVGRVIHGDVTAEHVWDPSGGAGWRRLDILSRNRGGPGIVTVPTDLAQPVDPKRVPVLHLTGVGPLTLDDEAKKDLKAYVEAGGLLLVDAAGGRQPFVDSFTKLAEEMFGSSALAPAGQLPAIAAASENGDLKFWYRHRDNLPKSLRPIEVLGVKVTQPDGRANWNVLFFPYDLSYALVGAPASDPAGLEPAAAEKLVLSLLNWRTSPGPAAATQPASAAETQPTSAPATQP